MKSDVVLALETAGWPVLLVDSTGAICRANPAAVRFFGAPLEGALPQLSALWSAENRCSIEQLLADCAASTLPLGPVKFRVKSGGELACAVSVCSFTQEGQKFFLLQLPPEGALPAGEGRSQNGEGNTAQKQKLECALQLARTVALDFNNALTSILGHVSLVLGQMEPQNSWRASLLEVEKSAAKAAEIANDLGTFSRQENEVRAQPAGNLNLLLQRTVELFQQNSAGQPVEWQLLLERKLFAAKFDEAKMQQALVKILENALQALRHAGRIAVQTRNLELAEPAQDRNVRLAPGAYVTAEISDNGCGIEPQVLPRIFEPFFTTKGGTHRGLGLALVYGIVTNHGGGVAVSSQPGTGTSVRLYLPAETRIVSDPGVSQQELSGTQTILVVDDEDLVLTMHRTILSAFGYRVLTAISGQKALELLAGEPAVDLVITDLVMPAMSGRELIEHLRRLSPALPVLCTSGYVWPGSPESETAYLQKPFTAQALLLKVKQILRD